VSRAGNPGGGAGASPSCEVVSVRLRCPWAVRITVRHRHLPCSHFCGKHGTSDMAGIPPANHSGRSPDLENHSRLGLIHRRSIHHANQADPHRNHCWRAGAAAVAISRLPRRPRPMRQIVPVAGQCADHRSAGHGYAAGRPAAANHSAGIWAALLFHHGGPPLNC